MTDTDFELQIVLRHDSYRRWAISTDPHSFRGEEIDPARAIAVVQAFAPDRVTDAMALTVSDAEKAEEALAAKIEREAEERERGIKSIIDLERRAAARRAEADDLTVNPKPLV